MSRYNDIPGGGGSSGTVLPSVNGGRLSLHASDSQGEASAAGTLYLHQHAGNLLAIHDGSSAWSYLPIASTPLSIALSGGTASKLHDVFAYGSAGAVALEMVVWTDDTTRATALAQQDGVWVKTGDTTRRYLGTIYLDGSKQATDDSTKRDLWNEANRVSRQTRVVDTTNSWTYSTRTWREANGSTANRIYVTTGRSAAISRVQVVGLTSSSVSGQPVGVGIGLGSTTVDSTQLRSAGGYTNNFISAAHAYYAAAFAPGRIYVAWIEQATGTGVGTFYGDFGTYLDFYQAGLKIESEQ